jgi:hypothetical protein
MTLANPHGAFAPDAPARAESITQFNALKIDLLGFGGWPIFAPFAKVGLWAFSL